MQINASLSSHTLALFGASAERSDNPLMSPDTPEAKGADATKYTVATRAEGAGFAQGEPAPQDSASSYRPSINPDFVNSTYADPRMSSSPADNAAAPAYDGPSYTELAGGDLLGKVMSDLEGIKNNQLAAMKEEFQSRVEATIGRELTEGEDVNDFHTQAIISNEDWQLGMDTRVMASKVGRAIHASGDLVTVGSNPLMYRDDLPPDEREKMIIDDTIKGIVDGQVRAIQDVISNSNQLATSSEGLLPTLTEDEVLKLRETLLAEQQERLESGELVIRVSDMPHSV
ncbi:hypothetical protein KUV57_24815 [Epibacterium sp. DP7N7-1]|nr:hypothetical protein [Epibacterium sp. DP7N7-1]